MLRFIKYFSLLTGGSVLLYLAVALVLALIPSKPPQSNCAKDRVVYLWSNGVHLDLIMRPDQLSPEMVAKLDPPHWAEFMVVGWGEKDFYINTPTWSDLRSGPAFRALFNSGQAALHIVWLQNHYQGWVPLNLCKEQEQQIRKYLENTFVRDSAGDLLAVQAEGYSDRDKFYLAKGRFSCFHTCNNWVNRGLKEAGIRTAIWSPFDIGVLYHVKE